MPLADHPELDETRSVKLCLPMLLDSTGRIDQVPDRSLVIPQAPEQIARSSWTSNHADRDWVGSNLDRGGQIQPECAARAYRTCWPNAD